MVTDRHGSERVEIRRGTGAPQRRHEFGVDLDPWIQAKLKIGLGPVNLDELEWPQEERRVDQPDVRFRPTRNKIRPMADTNHEIRRGGGKALRVLGGSLQNRPRAAAGRQERPTLSDEVGEAGGPAGIQLGDARRVRLSEVHKRGPQLGDVRQGGGTRQFRDVLTPPRDRASNRLRIGDGWRSRGLRGDLRCQLYGRRGYFGWRRIGGVIGLHGVATAGEKRKRSHSYTLTSAPHVDEMATPLGRRHIPQTAVTPPRQDSR